LNELVNKEVVVYSLVKFSIQTWLFWKSSWKVDKWMEQIGSSCNYEKKKIYSN